MEAIITSRALQRVEKNKSGQEALAEAIAELSDRSTVHFVYTDEDRSNPNFSHQIAHDLGKRPIFAPERASGESGVSVRINNRGIGRYVGESYIRAVAPGEVKR